MITVEMVKALLNYDTASGVFTWRERTPIMFKVGRRSTAMSCKIWNAKHAGKKAGIVSVNGYIQIGCFGRDYYGHRLAWVFITGHWPPDGLHIDHADGDRANNAKTNLRLASNAQNMANAGACSRNTSGIKGVSWKADCKKWRVRFGRKHYFGLFDNKEDAAAAYEKAAREIAGEFARPVVSGCEP